MQFYCAACVIKQAHEVKLIYNRSATYSIDLYATYSTIIQ